MGHLIPSALWTLQRQSQLRIWGGKVLLTYLIPFSILQNRPLIFNQWASFASNEKNEPQRHQKAPVFIGVSGVLISFDTSHVFMVVGGEGTNGILTEPGGFSSTRVQHALRASSTSQKMA